MTRPISIINTYTVAASTTQKVSIYRVGPSEKFRLKKVKVHFPVGTENYLKVAVLYGIRNVVPEQGYFMGDGVVLEAETDFEYEAGSTVDIYMENMDTSNSHTFTIIIIGEIE